jgi:hypothetical protein
MSGQTPLALVLLAFSSGDARAQTIYAGIDGGYGFAVNDEYNPYGVGVGAHAGIVVPWTSLYAAHRDGLVLLASVGITIL